VIDDGERVAEWKTAGGVLLSGLRDQYLQRQGLILTVPALVEVKAGATASFQVTVERELIEGDVLVEFEAPPEVMLNRFTINGDQSNGQGSVTAGRQAKEQDYAVKVMASCDTVTAPHQNMVIRIIRD